MKKTLLFASLYLLSLNIIYAQCAAGTMNGPVAFPAGTCDGSTTTVTLNAGEQYCYNVTAGNDYTFATCGLTTNDTQITVYEGGVDVDFNDDGCGLQSTVTYNATTGQICVQASTFNCAAADGSTYDVEVSCTMPAPAPANDLCTGAEMIACGATLAAVDASGATDTDAPGDCAGTVGPGVWYELSSGGIINGSMVTVTLTPDAWDAEVQILSGSCGTFTCEDNQDGAGTGGAEAVTITYDNTLTYYIYVGTWSSTVTTIAAFDLDIACVAPPACPPPTALAATNLMETSADLSWTAGGSEVLWNIEYGAPGFALGTGTMMAGVTNPFTLTGLTACTDYEYYVVADCGVDGTSTAAGPFSFSTPGPPVNLMPACGETVTYPVCPGNYAANEDITWTLCPDPGTYAVLELTYLDLEVSTSQADMCWDQLNIMGISLEIVCGEPDGDGDVGPGNMAGDCFYHPVAGTDGTDNCITVQFDSDGSIHETGFSFVFTCVADPTALACNSTALPVEFVDFTGTVHEKVNTLNWEIASEFNTQWHIVERSEDGRTAWKELGREKASGTSVETTTYTFNDLEPLPESYYRIRSLDFDGSEEISSVIFLSRTGKQFGIVNVSPVPTKNLVTVDYITTRTSEIQVSVTDMFGKEIRRIQTSVNEGVNQVQLNLEGLANGFYLVRLDDGINSSVRKIVKQ